MWTLICLNEFALLSYTTAISFWIKPGFILGGILQMTGVCMCLKTVSFHHVMHDVRWLCLKVIKLEAKGEKLEPSKVEKTILGVPMETYTEAMKYPNCLRYRYYMTYILMPTFCYQLKYP